MAAISLTVGLFALLALAVSITSELDVRTLEILRSRKKALRGGALGPTNCSSNHKDNVCLDPIHRLISPKCWSTNNAIYISRQKERKATSYLRSCYYGFSTNQLTPERLNATMCTHILVEGGALKNGLLAFGDASMIDGVRRINALKRKNQELKVMLSIMGAADLFSNISCNSLHREVFAKQATAFLIENSLDGLDFDWEFPAWKGGKYDDKENFPLLLEEVRKTFDSHPQKLLLSAAVGAPKTVVDRCYDVPKIASQVDFINLMTYDFHFFDKHNPLSWFTGHNSPLFPRHTEVCYFATENTAWSVNAWIKLGMPASKLLVGIPTYGHTYQLLLSFWHGLSAPATGNGIDFGYINYSQVCKMLSTGGTRKFDSEGKVPYMYQKSQWISYEDLESITAKVNWTKQQRLAGTMTFNINSDDWQGVCQQGAFPLQAKIVEVFNEP